MPPCHLMYIFDPATNRVNNNLYYSYWWVFRSLENSKLFFKTIPLDKNERRFLKIYFCYLDEYEHHTCHAGTSNTASKAVQIKFWIIQIYLNEIKIFNFFVGSSFQNHGTAQQNMLSMQHTKQNKTDRTYNDLVWEIVASRRLDWSDPSILHTL